jgi:SAM-dependent methyltransferase
MNENARRSGSEKGIKIINETVEEHAKNFPNHYDVVCFFQVLEHIHHVDEFLQSSVDSLKTGGKLILAVPNNDPYFLKYDKYQIWNFPPHHMGWWNEMSLTALQGFYSIRLESISTENLSHYKEYTTAFLKNKFERSSVIRRFLYPFFKITFFLLRRKIKGGSIAAVYTKL